MSKSAMVISLLLVIALSVVGVALLVAPPAPASAGHSDSLLRIDPAMVRSIRVAPVDSDTASVIDRTDAGGWTVRIERDGQQMTHPWPAQPASVRAIVRTLCDLRDEGGSSNDNLGAVDPALLVTVTLSDSTTHEVRFDRNPLGGRRLVEIDGRRTGDLDDQVFRALTAPGPSGWRVGAPLANVGERTARIAIRAPGKGPGIELARLEGRWFLRVPVQSRAADSAASALLSAVASLRIDRFIDDPASISAKEVGLDEPRLICRVDEDLRSINPDDGQVRTTTRSQTLTIGGPADLSGQQVFASITSEHPGDPETFVVLNIEPIETVSLSGEGYLLPVAAETIRPNIGALSVRIAGQPEARFERGIERWRLLDASGATVGDADAGPIETLLTALTETPATSMSLEAPDSYRPIASITIFDFGGGPLETIEAGKLESGALALRTGQVFRVYEGAEAPSLLLGAGLR